MHYKSSEAALICFNPRRIYQTYFVNLSHTRQFWLVSRAHKSWHWLILMGTRMKIWMVACNGMGRVLMSALLTRVVGSVYVLLHKWHQAITWTVDNHDSMVPGANMGAIWGPMLAPWTLLSGNILLRTDFREYIKILMIYFTELEIHEFSISRSQWVIYVHKERPLLN